MPTKILCSTGTLVGRANGYNHRIVTENHKNIDADGFELMMLNAYYERLSEVIRDFEKACVNVETISPQDKDSFSPLQELWRTSPQL